MSRQRNMLFGWAAALIAMALFSSAGVWQVRRMHEKQELLDAAQRTLSERRAVGLTAALEEFNGGFIWAEGEGQLDVRGLLLDGQHRGGRAGVRLYCLFEPDGNPRARSVLVDFGWLPMDGQRRLPKVDCPAGRLRLRGLVSAPPSPGLRLGDSLTQVNPDLWLDTRIEPSRLAKEWRVMDGLYPTILRLDPKLPLGYARDFDILPNTLPPERHLGYAVQWFALALAVFVTATILTFRNNRR